MTLDEKRRAHFLRLRTEFPYYAKRCLKIKDKHGSIIPFALNKAQHHINARIEHQLATFGRVRALLLKARQQGGSTYMQGRLYWRTSLSKGKTAFILTHEDKATQNLFSMGKRFHDHAPLDMRPTTGRSNANQLVFSRLESQYAVGTARSSGTGRSFTAQYFHGSEAAFWANAREHMNGLGQAIPAADGTEVVLESTANGTGNPFYEWAMGAMEGRGDYQLIFTPWFWSDEYTRTAPDDYYPTGDEADYMALHRLTREHMYWRHRKIEDEFDGDDSRFAQEYPATVQEAFMAGAAKAYIAPLDVLHAMQTAKLDVEGAPIVLGVDVGEYGEDATVITEREGRKVYPQERIYKQGTMAVAGIVAARLDTMKRHNRYPDAVFVDATGVGSGVADRLMELGFKNVIRVHFGASADNRDVYSRKRDECWGRMRDWLREPPVELPKDEMLKMELSAPEYTYDSSRRLVLEPKESMQKRGISSPDGADSLALTFSYPVVPKRDRTPQSRLAERMRRYGNTETAMSA